MTNVEKISAEVRHSSFVIDSSSICHSSSRTKRAFTLIELVVVVGIITVLTGLVLSTVSYARKKAALARAETEIAAVSAACESYRADNGVYPRDPTPNTATDALNARTMFDPVVANATQYKSASLVLYRALSGDRNLDRTVSAADENFNIDGSPLSPPLTQLPISYFTFKPSMLSPADQSQNVQYIRDPFGNSYGYSTAYQYDPTTGYNPTFDLWSTANYTSQASPTPTPSPQNFWIKNW